MKALNKLMSLFGPVLRWFCVTLLALLVLLVVFQVVVRQVFNSGIAWTEAAARYVFIWQGLIGAAYVIGENDDVAIDFLVRKFPAAVSRTVEAIAHAVVAVFAVTILILGGGEFVARSWDQTVELLPITTGQIYLVLPISGLLILLYSIAHMGEAITRPLVVKNEEDIDITTLREEGI